MPVIKLTIDATQLWVDTGLTLDGAQTVSITAQGLWTANPANGLVDANGHSGLIAKPGYNLEGAFEGLLVGQVSPTGSAPVVFRVGTQGSVPPGLAGELTLSINDDMFGQYGVGFKDNQGSVEVSITISDS
jgi:hypothetical protein